MLQYLYRTWYRYKWCDDRTITRSERTMKMTDWNTWKILNQQPLTHSPTHSLTPSPTPFLLIVWLLPSWPSSAPFLQQSSNLHCHQSHGKPHSRIQGFQAFYLSHPFVIQWSVVPLSLCWLFKKSSQWSLTVRLTHSPLSTCVAYRFWIDLFFLLSVTVEMFLRVPIVNVQFPPPRSVASAWHRMMIKCDFNLDPQHRTASPAGRKTLI